MAPMFPKISTKTDKSGHSIAYPDICKIPVPPAPFSPAPYPAEHAKKLAGAKKVVIQALKTLEKSAKSANSSSSSSSSGDEAGVQKAIVSMKSLEKLIQKHEGELKKAPRTDYSAALRVQQKFEKEVERQVKEMDKALRKDRDGQKLVKEIVKVVGKAARAQ